MALIVSVCDAGRGHECNFSLFIPRPHDPETLGRAGQFPEWEGRANGTCVASWCVASQVPARVTTSAPSGVLQLSWESGVPKARPLPRSGVHQVRVGTRGRAHVQVLSGKGQAFVPWSLQPAGHTQSCLPFHMSFPEGVPAACGSI